MLHCEPLKLPLFLWMREQHVRELWTNKKTLCVEISPALGRGLSGWLSLPRTDPQVTRHCAAGINNARHFLQPPRRENYISLRGDWQRHKKRRGLGSESRPCARLQRGVISHCEEPKSGECRTNHRVPLAGETCGEKSHVEVQLEKGKKNKNLRALMQWLVWRS